MQVSTKVLTESEYGNWKKGKQGIKKHTVSGIHIGSTQAKLVYEQDTIATITLIENTKKCNKIVMLQKAVFKCLLFFGW